MVVYCMMTPERAIRILRDGFDEQCEAGLVRVTEQPTAFGAGPEADTILQLGLEISERKLFTYEVAGMGTRFRQWCIPARVLNRASIRVCQWGIIGIRRSGLTRSQIVSQAHAARAARRLVSR